VKELQFFGGYTMKLHRRGISAAGHELAEKLAVKDEN